MPSLASDSDLVAALTPMAWRRSLLQLPSVGASAVRSVADEAAKIADRLAYDEARAKSKSWKAWAQRAAEGSAKEAFRFVKEATPAAETDVCIDGVVSHGPDAILEAKGNYWLRFWHRWAAESPTLRLKLQEAWGQRHRGGAAASTTHVSPHQLQRAIDKLPRKGGVGQDQMDYDFLRAISPEGGSHVWRPTCH